jgi:hypothetical protein
MAPLRVGIGDLSHAAAQLTSFLPKNWPTGCSISAMHPITFLGLLEEMIDIKIQQQTEARLKTTPEVAAVLHQKRETDKRRIDQIRAELLRLMSAQ